jgi:hypothetical protein
VATQLLIYGQVEAVNKQRHLDWSVKAGVDYNFAKDVNSVPLMAVEFPQAAQDYAIVFAGDEKGLLPVVVMGVRQDENLYLDEAGAWTVDYVPAFVRRFPFVFANSDDGDTLTLCIDENFEGCNQEGRGERLFDSEGEKTQYLTNVLGFLQDYQAHYQRTQMFCNKLSELELFEDMAMKFTSPAGEERTLTGFKVINREKLKNLSAESLHELMANDSLELIYMHLQSMSNMNKMVQTLPNKDADFAVTPDVDSDETATTQH